MDRVTKGELLEIIGDDIDRVTGSGSNGKVLKVDLVKHLNRSHKKEKQHTKVIVNQTPERKSKRRRGTWFIHDNGSRPFKVITSSNEIKIYIHSDEVEDEYDTLLMVFEDPLDYWIGEDVSEPAFRGNNILVQLTDSKYVYIGTDIHQFESRDQIIDFLSPVGNSDVPYSYSFTQNDIFFNIEQKKGPIGCIDLSFDDPYHYLYFNKDYPGARKYRVKTLQKRL